MCIFKLKGYIVRTSTIITAVTIGILLSGCGQPEFNRNSKSVAFVDGKPYAIPYGASYGSTISSDKERGLKTNGITSCKKGDRYWMSTDFYNKHIQPYISINRERIQKAKKNILTIQDDIFKNNPFKTSLADNLDQINKRVKRYTPSMHKTTLGYIYYPDAYAIRNGKAGCTRALNKQEYQYMLNQQNQSAANQRARMNYDATTAPKYYNVNYTGTVYHY